jgi:hypothetical protein
MVTGMMPEAFCRTSSPVQVPEIGSLFAFAPGDCANIDVADTSTQQAITNCRRVMTFSPSDREARESISDLFRLKAEATELFFAA